MRPSDNDKLLSCVVEKVGGRLVLPVIPLVYLTTPIVRHN